MRWGVIILLLALYAVLSCQQVSFRTSADLGRLLEDGRLITTGEHAVLHRNYYSYTNPDAPFVNHHWLTAVIFYEISKSAGLATLSSFYIALGAIAFLLYFRIAEQEGGLALASLAAVFLMPLLAPRAGLRPEIFSILLLSVFTTLLWSVHRGSLRGIWLWLLPVLELLWVNLHPGFALGPVLIGTFLLCEMLARRWGASGRTSLRTLAGVLGLTVAAGLANPNGVRGLLFPLTVSSNYAMAVRENLSVFQLEDNWLTVLIEAVIAVFAIACVIAWRRSKQQSGILARLAPAAPILLVTAALAAASVTFFRVYVFLAGFLLVSFCLVLRPILESRPKAQKRPNKARRQQATNSNAPATGTGIPPLLLASLSLVALGSNAAALAGQWDRFGLGLVSGDDEVARFMRDNGIRGRVFNGYASASYLLHYFPDQPVYVDSRPEAYPGGFIRDEYVSPLENEDAWGRIEKTYDFDFICFVLMNQDEGRFILRRAHDPDWALVLGGDHPVLVRRKPQFAGLIARREIRF